MVSWFVSPSQHLMVHHPMLTIGLLLLAGYFIGRGISVYIQPGWWWPAPETVSKKTPRNPRLDRISDKRIF